MKFYTKTSLAILVLLQISQSFQQTVVYETPTIIKHDSVSLPITIQPALKLKNDDFTPGESQKAVQQQQTEKQSLRSELVRKFSPENCI
jgi:hypothetical protein